MKASQDTIEKAHEVVARLLEKGHEAYFAGGYVRDLLLGLHPHDVDVVTSATPDQVKAIFKRTVEVGVQFGIVVVVMGEARFEVATFRTESGYADGRRPDSVRFASAREDASRRDFTINGLFFDPVEKKTIDFVGGRDDLRRGVVRAIGDPDARFDEDKLRILRAPRFAAKLRFRLDEATARAARRRCAEVAIVSHERIRDELDKMLLHPSRARGLELLDDLALVPVVLPEVAGPLFARGRAIVAALPAAVSSPLAWAALLAPLGPAGAEQVMARLRHSKKDTEGVRELVGSQGDLLALAERPLHFQKRLLARDDVLDLCSLARAEALAEKGGDLEPLRFAEARRAAFRAEKGPSAWSSPPLIRGQDLFAVGLKAGPRFKDLLARAEELRLDGLATTKEACLALLKAELPDAFSG